MEVPMTYALCPVPHNNALQLIPFICNTPDSHVTDYSCTSDAQWEHYVIDHTEKNFMLEAYAISGTNVDPLRRFFWTKNPIQTPLYKKNMLFRLFGPESWQEWLEWRTALGKVAMVYKDYRNSPSFKIQSRLQPAVIERATFEAQVILRNAFESFWKIGAQTTGGFMMKAELEDCSSALLGKFCELAKLCFLIEEPIDLAIVLDTTTPMEKFMPRIQKSLHYLLTNVIKNGNRDNWPVRAGLVEYHTDKVVNISQFTPNLELAAKHLMQIQPSDNKSKAQNGALDALAAVSPHELTMDWNFNAKRIVLFFSSSSIDPESESRQGLDAHFFIEQFKKNCITLYPFFVAHRAEQA
jgi:hypothetical protein